MTKRKNGFGLIGSCWLLVAVLSALAGCRQEISDSVPQQITGAYLYRQNCAVCHGSKGHMQTGRTNLRDSSLSEAQTRKVIEAGRGGMPGFGRRMNDDELDMVTGFTLGLRETQN